MEEAGKMRERKRERNFFWNGTLLGLKVTFVLQTCVISELRIKRAGVRAVGT